MIGGAGHRKTSVRKALSLSFIQTLVSLVFGFGSVIIVSRLLTPAEIGVFSVAAGVLGLVQMLRDFGVTEFLIQEEHLDESKIRTVFTISLAIAWTLGVLLFVSSGALGEFYGHAGVTKVLRVLSIVFFLLPFGAITQTLLKRDLEFGKLIKIQLAQNITRNCATVALAYAGFTYMSMAWSSLVSIVVMVIGCAVWGRRHRVHGLGLEHWKRVFHFGSNRTIADIANQVGEQSANLVVGRVLGMAATGMYSRGYGVVNLFRTNIGGAIGSVAFPAFAREHREKGTAPQLFLKSRVYLTGISWPFFSAGIILAFPIIRVLFGNQWDAAVPLMRWLCAAAIIDTLTYQCDVFLVAIGRVRTATRIAVQFQLARAALTIMAAFVSLVAVAAVQVLVYVIGTALYYRELGDFDALSIRSCIKSLIPSVTVTLATCVVPTIVVLWPGFVHGHMVLAFGVAVIGGCIGWLAAVLIIPHPLADELRHLASRFPRLRRMLYG
jgi:O-antigen/teichoic acid export membrane protein